MKKIILYALLTLAAVGLTSSALAQTGCIKYQVNSFTTGCLPIGSSGQLLTVVGGLPSWQPAPASGWSLTGNSGITGANFIGTTNNISLRFRVNNVQKMMLDSFGNFGIGITAPTAKLHVVGTGTNIAFQVDSNGVNLFKIHAAGQIEAGHSVTKNLIFGFNSGLLNTGGENTSFGVSCFSSNTIGNSNTSFGYNALTLNSTGSNNVAFGKGAGQNNTGSNNVFIGYEAGLANLSNGDNMALGTHALYNSTGNNNMALGTISLGDNTTGSYNTSIGYFAMSSNIAGDFNTAVGLAVMGSNQDGNRNTAYGEAALYSNQHGNYNTTIGFQTGYNNEGSGNIFLGYNAGRGELTTSNTFIIDNTDRGTPFYSLHGSPLRITNIGGDSSNQAVRINGTLQINDGTQLAGDIFTSDANGIGSWKTPGNLLHTIFTPTVGASITLIDNKINIISPAGTLASLTVVFPANPSNNDFVEVTFDQIITSVTYTAGTGGATIKGQINGVVGGQKRWDYDLSTNTWY